MQTNVLEYLEATAKRSPERVAFTDGASSLTFGALYECAVRIGSALAIRLSGAVRRPVAVLENRTPNAIAAYLGVVYSGNYYVPLSHELPAERLRAIVELVRPAAVIAMDDTAAFLPAGIATTPFFALAEHEPQWERLQAIRARLTDIDPLYVLFTSGTTGAPKGVVTCHRAVIDYIDAFTEASGVDETDTLGGQASLDYVAAIRDIYLPLKLGARCMLLSKALFSMPARLLDALDEHRVTTLCWAVSALSILARTNAFTHRVPAFVNKVIFTGAVMPAKYLRVWQQALPDALYMNHYGPTEITASCTYAVIDHLVEAGEALPIGKPFRNTDILLVDDHGCEVTEADIQGELCVRGSGLALGYFGNPALTDAAFAQNPCHSLYRDPVYRTGDYASRDEKGVLWFHGRKDSQIKFMGHRVELSEIEATAKLADGVEDACCFFDAERERIMLVAQTSRVSPAELFAFLKERLPAFMVPRRLTVKERFPLLPNGKADRVALRREE